MTELPDAPWATKPDLPDAPWATKEPESEPVPQSFLHRIATGLMVGGSADASPEELRQKGYEDFNYPANVAQQFKGGLDRVREANAALKGGAKGMARAGAEWDQMMGGVQALASPLTAAFQLAGGMVEKGTGGLINSEAAQDALMLSDGAPARFSRVRNGVEQVVGELPKHEDFANAAAVLSPNEKGLRLVAAPEGGVYGPEQIKPGEKYFKALDKDGKTAAEMLVKIDGTTAKVEDIMNPALPRTDGRNAIGTSQMRSLLRQFQEQHPEVQEITGDRVSGARAGGGYDLDSEATTRLNLRDLWQERGIHPAEAVHDAQTDAFLKGDLTAKNLEPPDRSDIPPVQGTPAPQGTPRTQLAMTGEAHIDKILQSEPTKQVIDSPVVDREHTVPYTAGGSVPLEDPTFFIDRRFPQSFTIDGVTFDPASPFAVHENVEQHTMEMLIKGGMDDATAYKVAHFEFAEKAEGAWYAAHGVDQAKAEAAYAPYMAEIQKAKADNLPPNLYDRPYPHDAPSAAQHEAIAEPKPTAAEIAQAKAILADQEAGSALQAGGADVTRNVPSLTEQPPRPAGSLAAKGREAVDKLLGLAETLKGMFDPMSVGGKPFMVIAKDAMNSIRRIDFEHLQHDQFITRNFSLEQQVAMFDRLDEESVLLQEGKTSENMGLATLTPGERAAVDVLQGPSQAAWQHVRDVGIVQGDGLPAYAPRMLLAVSAGADSAGPRALNELGRNVFTRTGQMFHRKYLMAEDTEAAAKAMVAKQMAAKGASPEQIAAAVEKVQIARNIRALPLATAKLQKAAIYREMINNLEATGKAMGQQIVAYGERPDKAWFTVAGHPSFTRWRPVMEEADTAAYGEAYTARTGQELEPARIPLIDRNGNMVFRPEPVWIHPDAAGPLKSIFSTGVDENPIYGALMALKGKSMSVIMNSPMIHNQVVWSKVVEAVGGRDKLALGLYSRGNNIVREPSGARAGELIEHGLSPMGPRGAMQDITSIMEEPNLEPGRSWTAQVARAVPDLYDQAAGDAVGRSIDKMGDFWHNTLLWDRVRDLQFGLADHLSDHFVERGLPRTAADRVATHLSNMIVGSIPKEAMSAGARATANLLLFSRSYTLGNWAVIKTAFAGLPKPIMAQIERDIGVEKAGAIDQTGALAGPQFDLNKMAKTMAQKKAFSALVIGAGVFYVGKALMQHAFNIFGRDATIDDEARGYVRRYQNLMEEADRGNYMSLLNSISRLSPTYDNEPGKEDRVHMGYAQDGSAIYGRLPVGKYGEETVGTLTHPLSVLRSKVNPLPGSIIDLFYNDKGFGRKIYDDNWQGTGAMIRNGLAMAQHVVGRELPEGQLEAGVDLLRGDGDPTTNKLKLFGPMMGFTASAGAPGGMARGEQLSAKNAFESRFSLAWPDIRKQIQRGDVDGGRAALKDLGAPNYMINGLVRNANNPAGALRGHTLKEFYQYATPEQRQRMENAR